MSTLSQKLVRRGHVSDDILGFIVVKTWEVDKKWFVTSVVVDGQELSRKVTKGPTGAAKQHNESIRVAYRLYGGVWCPEKHVGKVRF